MRRFVKRVSLLALCSVLVSVAAHAQQPVDDWLALERLQKQLKGAEPQVAIDAYEKLYEDRPKMLPAVAVRLSQRVAEIYGGQLQNWDKVVEIDNWTIQKYPKQAEAILVVDNKIKALTTLNRLEEAGKACEAHWDIVLHGGQPGEEWLVMFAASALRGSCEAYVALKQPEKATALLLKAFSAMPSLLNDKAQGMGDWKNGWMYDMLVPQLIEAGRIDEALTWAKLQYVTSPADKAAIDRATRSAGRVWGEREEFQLLRAFARSQEEPAPADVENPLDTVKLPVFDLKLMKEHLARTETPPKMELNRTKTKERILIFLAGGDYVTALQEAGKLWQDLPKNPEGAENIRRVLKAGDLNLTRANQFTKFLEGKAPDPIPGFLKDMAAKAKGIRPVKPKATSPPASTTVTTPTKTAAPATPPAPPVPNPFGPSRPAPAPSAPQQPPVKGDAIP